MYYIYCCTAHSACTVSAGNCLGEVQRVGGSRILWSGSKESLQRNRGQRVCGGGVQARVGVSQMNLKLDFVNKDVGIWDIWRRGSSQTRLLWKRRGGGRARGGSRFDEFENSDLSNERVGTTQFPADTLLYILHILHILCILHILHILYFLHILHIMHTGCSEKTGGIWRAGGTPESEGRPKWKDPSAKNNQRKTSRPPKVTFFFVL